MVSLGEYLDHFQRRVLQDALAEATKAYWLRRAQDFEAAKPVEPPEGFRDPEQARKQWKRCHAAAEACRHAAELAPFQDFLAVDLVLDEQWGEAA